MSARFWFYPLHCLFHPNFGRANQTCCFYSTHRIRLFVGFNLQPFPCLSFPPSFPMKKKTSRNHGWAHMSIMPSLNFAGSRVEQIRAPNGARSAPLNIPVAPVISPTQCHFWGQISKVERGDSWWFMVIPHILLWWSSHVLVSIWSEMTWPFSTRLAMARSLGVSHYTPQQNHETKLDVFPSMHHSFSWYLVAPSDVIPKNTKQCDQCLKSQENVLKKQSFEDFSDPLIPPQRVPTCPNISSCPLALGVAGAPACQLMFKKPTSR